jgi:ribosomal protein L37AE/L43A
MSAIYENQLCYFCDEPYPVHRAIINKYNDIWVCHHCENSFVSINNEENGECSVCFENKHLIQLQSCIHKLCLGCCKTIYMGSTTNNRPMHINEMNHEQPIFPYETDDNEMEDENTKQDEYYSFEDLHFDYKTKTYDELMIIRDTLITSRPEWMNTQEFINYENENIKYQIKILNVEKEWDNWNENKIRGNRCCPLCRAKTH